MRSLPPLAAAAVAVAFGIVVVGAGVAVPRSAAAAPGAAPGTLGFTVRPPMLRSPMANAEVTPSMTPADCLARTGGMIACQTPASIRAAYDIPATVDGAPAGSGQTIVVVDAYGSPTVQADLDTFSVAMGLPKATLDVLYPVGRPTWHGSQEELLWAEETSLDVQWAHAVAPGATIDLVVAPTAAGAPLDLAQRYAVDHRLGNVMSLSFGDPEASINGNSTQAAQAHKIYADARAAGITVFASSGDSGSDNGAGYGNFAFPAADPLVTAVGGTTLYTGSGLDRPRETVWGDYANCPLTCGAGPLGATGGAPSVLGGKSGSDVSYDASVYTGMLTYIGFLAPSADGFYFMGGTSAGAPQWAAITAVLNQALGRPLGYLRDQLASWAAAGALTDVTVGSNATPSYPGGYSAGVGEDLPTGYGSPDVGRLLQVLGG